MVFLVPETHGPTILSTRAARLRIRGRKNARAAHELKEEPLRDFMRVHVGRPFGESVSLFYLTILLIADGVCLRYVVA